LDRIGRARGDGANWAWEWSESGGQIRWIEKTRPRYFLVMMTRLPLHDFATRQRVAFPPGGFLDRLRNPASTCARPRSYGGVALGGPAGKGSCHQDDE
jgi:hypothetical protein